MQAEFMQVWLLLKAVYDILPSPAYLYVWEKIETHSYPPLLWKRPLGTCTSQLPKGSSGWSDDRVLKAVADCLSSAKSSIKQHHTPKKAISFIKAGERPRSLIELTTGFLHTALDWHLQVNLRRQLKFPEYIAQTRHDHRLWGLKTSDLAGTHGALGRMYWGCQ